MSFLAQGEHITSPEEGELLHIDISDHFRDSVQDKVDLVEADNIDTCEEGPQVGRIPTGNDTLNSQVGVTSDEDSPYYGFQASWDEEESPITMLSPPHFDSEISGAIEERVNNLPVSDGENGEPNPISTSSTCPMWAEELLTSLTSDNIGDIFNQGISAKSIVEWLSQIPREDTSPLATIMIPAELAEASRKETTFCFPPGTLAMISHGLVDRLEPIISIHSYSEAATRSVILAPPLSTCILHTDSVRMCTTFAHPVSEDTTTIVNAAQDQGVVSSPQVIKSSNPTTMEVASNLFASIGSKPVADPSQTSLSVTVAKSSVEVDAGFSSSMERDIQANVLNLPPLSVECPSFEPPLTRTLDLVGTVMFQSLHELSEQRPPPSLEAIQVDLKSRTIAYHAMGFPREPWMVALEAVWVSLARLHAEEQVKRWQAEILPQIKVLKTFINSLKMQANLISSAIIRGETMVAENNQSLKGHILQLVILRQKFVHLMRLTAIEANMLHSWDEKESELRHQEEILLGQIATAETQIRDLEQLHPRGRTPPAITS